MSISWVQVPPSESYMTRVLLYTIPFCGYCLAAKRLLEGKAVAYEEIDVSGAADLRAEMVERAFGRLTVPQIFIEDRHVGGYDDLAQLDRQGRLDPLLRGDRQEQQ
jgi:glutaredoxin 3